MRETAHPLIEKRATRSVQCAFRFVDLARIPTRPMRPVSFPSCERSYATDPGDALAMKLPRKLNKQLATNAEVTRYSLNERQQQKKEDQRSEKRGERKKH